MSEEGEALPIEKRFLWKKGLSNKLQSAIKVKEHGTLSHSIFAVSQQLFPIAVVLF